MTATVNTTQELAAFLRNRRERLAPNTAGLPPRRGARRTPGLRREEVAELAGVSVDYVIRLEQGRGLRPSAEVVEALADALRLSDDERGYLFGLAGHRIPQQGKPAAVASTQLAQLVQDLSPLPAMVVNHRFDVLAWNREIAALIVDFDELPPRHRNTMWVCMLHPTMRDFYLEREKIIREGIADLRAAWAARPEDRALAELIEELTTDSAEFAQLWAQRDVEVRGRGRKLLQHPKVGPIAIDYEVLIPLQDLDQRLIVYRAADEESRVALADLR